MTLEEKETLIENLTTYVQENQNKLYRLAYSYCQNQETAMDILQEAITKAISKITYLREPKYLKTWFYRILVNTAIDYTKKKKQKSEVCIENYDLDMIKMPSQELTNTIVLYEQIHSLKPNLKTVIILRYFEDMKLEEIAKVTHCNCNTIKSRLYKALAELKRKMEEKD